jgi:predicted lipid carrier protein YhbT
MASRTEVERKLSELIARLDASDEGARSLADTLSEPRVLTVHVTDLDTRYWTELRDGRMGPLEEGPAPDRADIQVEAPSDVLVDLIDGKGALFSAYLAGRIRIDASMSDLLRLRRLL